MTDLTVAPRPYANAAALVTAAELWEILEIISRAREDDRKRIDVLEKALAQKGLAGPIGTVTIDPAVTDYIETRLWRTENKLDEVERNYLKYAGVHVPGQTYQKNSVISRRGLWVATTTTDETPGSGGESETSWKLIMKSERHPK